MALYIRDLGRQSAVEVPLHAAEAEYVAPTLAWTPDSSGLSYLALNRAQNEESVHFWDVAKGSDRTLLVEKDPYWINSLEPPYFLAGKQKFLWLSERGGWLHLYLYNMDGKLLRQVTRGEWMIDRPFFRKRRSFRLIRKASGSTSPPRSPTRASANSIA